MLMLESFLRNPTGLLFLVIAAGWLIGSLPLGKLRLGGSGVLISGLVFGHFGYFLPQDIQGLGVVLFVYAVGLKAGPQIWQSLKRSKGQFLLGAALIVLTASAVTWLCRMLLGFPSDMMAGVYAGAMTSTPALAAVTQTLESSAAPVGYGLAYPLGVLGVILAMQILPGLFRVNLAEEEKDYRRQFQQAPIERRCFRVTNPNVTGLPLAESLKAAAGDFRIARVQRDGHIFTPGADDGLQRDDIVLAVGLEKDLEGLKFLLGESTGQWIPESDEANSRWVTVTSKHFIGKRLGSLEISSLYGIIITRVRRSSLEFMPQTNFIFEAGDQIRISGTAADLERFIKIAGSDPRTLYETDILSLAVGLAAGVMLGLVRIPLGGGMVLSLGLAGGPLLAGLIFGYFGRFGKLTGHMPKAAVNLMGEMGLYFFLAVAGCEAGRHFAAVLMQQGPLLILSGVLITLLPIAVTAFIGRFLLKMNFLVLMGMICGGMTSTPALGILTSNTKSDVPSLAYAGIYPIAVLFTTLAAQWLVLF